jgi:hypothetical protein
MGNAFGQSRESAAREEKTSGAGFAGQNEHHGTDEGRTAPYAIVGEALKV